MEEILTYPVLKLSDAKEVAAALSTQLERFPASSAIDEMTFMQLEGKIFERSGGDWQKDEFLLNVRKFMRNVSEDRRYPDFNDTVLNEMFAKHIVEQSSLVSPRALQDPDFWRYLTLFPYRTYTRLRDKDYSEARYGGRGNRELNRWTLILGYLWGARLADGTDFSLISEYRKARLKAGLSESWVKDFYINNVVRRKWAGTTAAARALVKVVVKEKKLFDISNEYRPTPKFGALVGRASENFYFPAMDEDELETYFDGLLLRNIDRLAPQGLGTPDL